MTTLQTPGTAVASVNSTLIAANDTHQVMPPVSVLPPGSVLAQVGSVLAVVVVLILCGAWLVRKFGFVPGTRSSQLLNVRASCQVGQRERVVIVEVADTWLVLGVTSHQVSALHVLPSPLVDATAPPAARVKQADFRHLLQKIIKKKSPEGSS